MARPNWPPGAKRNGAVATRPPNRSQDPPPGEAPAVTLAPGADGEREHLDEPEHFARSAALALARALAALYGAELFCRCGRDWIDDDGRCPTCAGEAPLFLGPDIANRERLEAEYAEAVRHHEAAVTVGCPYCGAAPGSVCRTAGPSGLRRPKGIRDHRDRYRAAVGLLSRDGQAPP